MDSIIKDAMDYAKTIFAGDCSGHDYFHTLRVCRMAVQIAQAEKGRPANCSAGGAASRCG